MWLYGVCHGLKCHGSDKRYSLSTGFRQSKKLDLRCILAFPKAWCFDVMNTNASTDMVAMLCVEEVFLLDGWLPATFRDKGRESTVQGCAHSLDLTEAPKPHAG